MQHSIRITYFLVASILLSCKDTPESKQEKAENTVESVKELSVVDTTVVKEVPKGIEEPEGMVWIPGEIFMQGPWSKINWPWAMRNRPTRSLLMVFL